MNLKNLSDSALLQNTKDLVHQERVLLTEVLWHLREIERRRLFSDLGFSSLYDYATRHLHYSNDQAFRRISAMRLLKELPEVSEKLESGELNLSHMVIAQSFFHSEKVITQHELSRNEKLVVLKQLESKSSREAQKVVFGLSSSPEELKRPEKQKVISNQLTELNFLADQELLDAIHQIKGLLAHSNPNISLSELVKYLCKIGLQKLDKTKTAGERKSDLKKSKDNDISKSFQVTFWKSKVESEATNQKGKLSNFGEAIISTQSQISPWTIKVKPETAKKYVKPSKLRAYVPINIRKQLWKKSKSRCESCHSQFALQIDHRKPVCLDGDSSLENLRLLCRNCNQRAAMKSVSLEHMDRFLG